MARLTLISAAMLLASACARPEVIRPLLPPAADLAVEPAPLPPPEIVTDAAADERFRAQHEAWGRRGWAAVARVCRWAKANGAAVGCPPVR